MGADLHNIGLFRLISSGDAPRSEPRCFACIFPTLCLRRSKHEKRSGQPQTPPTEGYARLLASVSQTHHIISATV